LHINGSLEGRLVDTGLGLAVGVGAGAAGAATGAVAVGGLLVTLVGALC
jgi:hypothetical protein